MSHEIRTPLNGVYGMAQLLSGSELTPEQRDTVETISASCDQLLAIINEVLDFSKIEAGKIEIEERAFRLPAILDVLVKTFSVQAEKLGLELESQIHSGVPSTVVGDSTRLSQVLSNLIGNSLKFTERGKIRVTVERIDHDGEGVMLAFGVSDTGSGIPAAKLGTLFDPFSQAGASTTRRYGGTGLGLTISKRLVELMNGEIRVDSEEGVGTTVEFTILTAAPGADQQEGATASSRTSPTSPPTTCRSRCARSRPSVW